MERHLFLVAGSTQDGEQRTMQNKTPEMIAISRFFCHSPTSVSIVWHDMVSFAWNILLWRQARQALKASTQDRFRNSTGLQVIFPMRLIFNSGIIQSYESHRYINMRDESHHQSRATVQEWVAPISPNLSVVNSPASVLPAVFLAPPGSRRIT